MEQAPENKVERDKFIDFVSKFQTVLTDSVCELFPNKKLAVTHGTSEEGVRDIDFMNIHSPEKFTDEEWVNVKEVADRLMSVQDEFDLEYNLDFDDERQKILLSETKED